MPNGPVIRRFQQEAGPYQEPPAPPVSFSAYSGNEYVPTHADTNAQAELVKYFNSFPYDEDGTIAFHGTNMRSQLQKAARSAVTDDGLPIPLDEHKYKQNSFSQFVRRNPTNIRQYSGNTDHSHDDTDSVTLTNTPGRFGGASIHDIANHEYEHARTPYARFDYGRGRNPVNQKLPWGASDPVAEIPAVLGDMVFMGRAASKSLGQKDYDANPLHAAGDQYDIEPPTEATPYGRSFLTKPALEHTVKFPSGHSHNINSMIQQAEQHGYFDGRTMTELLATPEGKQYLKMITQAPPKDYDLDIKPRLAELRDDDRFNRTVRKAKAQTTRDSSLLDRLMGAK